MALTKVPNSLLTTPPTDYDDDGLQNDLAILGFKVAANGSLAKYNLVDQIIDDFQDASGVDAGASTNEIRDSSGKYYSGGTSATPSVSGNYDSTTVDGDYTYYKWTTVTSSGTYTTDVAQPYEYLVVAGGGGGGASRGGGGGAGGMLSATGFSVAATTISGITVGAGGAGATASDGIGVSGSNSVFSTITSTGGGGGQGSGGSTDAGDGGSGGGATSDHAADSYGDGTAGQGNDGAYGSASPNYGAGGGGGAGAAGTFGTTTNGGAGGVGESNSITGSAVFYAGGGGGGSYQSGSSSGGNGGGGGAVWNANGTAGTANLGGGGGGGGHTGGTQYNGGAGGSGIVIIRRPTIGDVEGGNLTLVSTTTTAQAAPTKGDIVFTYTNGAGTTTLGGGSPDVTAEYSADGGSTWTSMTLGSEGTTGGHNIATAHDVALTSTSGTSMAYRIKTLNQSVTKTTRIHAVSLGWS
jgi:hypothetical protein